MRPMTPSGVTGPTTLVKRPVERKHPTQCAGRALASAVRMASLNALLPVANSL
jgi:hypothetical protein